MTNRKRTFLVHDFHIPKTEDQCREKLREEFERNRGIKDIRVIDMLVIKVSYLEILSLLCQSILH